MAIGWKYWRVFKCFNMRQVMWFNNHKRLKFLTYGSSDLMQSIYLTAKNNWNWESTSHCYLSYYSQRKQESFCWGWGVKEWEHCWNFLFAGAIGSKSVIQLCPGHRYVASQNLISRSKYLIAFLNRPFVY